MFHVTREIDFCYGHRLLNYEGKCKHLHGHNGKVLITLQASRLDERGMVLDFGDIKAVMNTWIDDHLDHRMILCRRDPAIELLKKLDEPMFLLDENPTAENIARLISDVTAEKGFPVVEVRLWETPQVLCDVSGRRVDRESLQRRVGEARRPTWDGALRESPNTTVRRFNAVDAVRNPPIFTAICFTHPNLSSFRERSFSPLPRGGRSGRKSRASSSSVATAAICLISELETWASSPSAIMKSVSMSGARRRLAIIMVNSPAMSVIGRTPRIITRAPTRRTKSTASPWNVKISTFGKYAVAAPDSAPRVSAAVNMTCFSMLMPTAMIKRSNSRLARSITFKWPSVIGSNDPG